MLSTVCLVIKDTNAELRMSAISCLAFLLSLEIQKDSLGKTNVSLQTVMDTTLTLTSIDHRNNLRGVISDVNKLSLKSANVHSRKSNENEDAYVIHDKAANRDEREGVTIDR